MVADGRKVQLLAQHLDHGVLHVLALLLDVVVGEVVPALAELVVPPPVLEGVVAHAAGQRGRGRGPAVRLVARVRAHVVAVHHDAAAFFGLGDGLQILLVFVRV